MKIDKFILFIIIFFSNNVFGQDIIDELRNIENRSQFIIDYVDKDLDFVLKEIATFKGINLLIPQENQKINAKITLHLSQKLTLDQAWNLVLEGLSIAGYSLREQQDVFTVIRNTNFASENLPIYINQTPPNNEMPVRYLYYFQNLNVSSKQENFTQSSLALILNDILTEPAKNNYMWISSSNALLITDKGSVINGVMNILKQFDERGFSESVAVIPLRFAVAKDVYKVLTKIIPANKEIPFFKNEKESLKEKCIPEETKITPLDYSNSLVLIGTKKAIQCIKNIIINYLDIAIEADRSVITVVKLDHLNAEEFAPVLKKIIQSRANQQSGSQSTGTNKTLGLADAIVVAEGSSENKDNQRFLGSGNNLLIAARKQDTKMLLNLIEEMDKPEPQVVLECVITSLTQDQLNGLGFLDTRSPNNPYDPSLIKWQANTQGTQGQPILNFISTPPNLPPCNSTNINSSIGLAADILAPCTGVGSGTGRIQNITTQGQTPGTLFISFSNGCGGVASLLQIFDQLNIKTDFKDPFIVTKNNTTASINTAETRLVQGATQQESTGGAVIINRDEIKAALKLELKPRIAFDDTVNLDLLVEVSNFLNPVAASGNNTIDRRVIKTSAHLKSGEILVIGGVSQNRQVDKIEQSPFAKIPLLGWLFKKQTRRLDGKNIYIFISPVIIRKSASIGVYQDVLKNSFDLDSNLEPNTFTGKKILQLKEIFKLEEKNLYGNNFEGLRDPITTIFFKPTITDSKNSGSFISLK